MYVTSGARENFGVRKRADDILICVINPTDKKRKRSTRISRLLSFTDDADPISKRAFPGIA